MPYALQPGFVVMVSANNKQVINPRDLEKLDDIVLALDGRYSLANASDMSKKQFERAYPEFINLIAAKNNGTQPTY